MIKVKLLHNEKIKGSGYVDVDCILLSETILI